jgi:hypothetical protein
VDYLGENGKILTAWKRQKMTKADVSIPVNQPYPAILAKFAEFQYYNVHGEFRVIKEIDQDGFAIFNVHHSKENKAIGKVIARSVSEDECLLDFIMGALSNEDIKERMAALEEQVLLCGLDANNATEKSGIELQDELYEKAREILYLERSMTFVRFSRGFLNSFTSSASESKRTTGKVINRKFMDREKRKKDVGEMYLAGEKIRTIAQSVGASRSTVKRDLEELELTKKKGAS